MIRKLVTAVLKDTNAAGVVEPVVEGLRTDCPEA
jgi:hypothetical protein